MSFIRGVIIYITILLMTLIYVKNIHTGFIPDYENKYITVIVQCSSYDEKQIESGITNLLENELYLVKGILELTSISEYEKSIVSLKISDSAVFSSVYSDVREKVDKTVKNLPHNAGKPLILKSSMENHPVFISFFPGSSNLSKDRLKLIYEKASGIGELETGGDIKNEVLIDIDREAIYKLDTGFDDIAKTVRQNNSAGKIKLESGLSLILRNKFKTINDIRSIHINPFFKLSDISDTLIYFPDNKSSGRYNGQEGVVVYIKKAGDANTVELCRELRQITLSAGGKIVYDYGETIEKAFNETFTAIGFGIILLTAAVYIFYKSFYLFALIMLNLVFSLAGASAAVKAAGFELDMMALAGLSITAATAIDTGIIFIESYHKNNNPLKPLLISSLTTIAVFIPLLFSSPALYRLFGCLAVTVSSGIAFSLFFTFMIMPALLSRFKPGSLKLLQFQVPDKAYQMIKTGKKLPVLSAVILLTGISVILFFDFKKEISFPDSSSTVTLILEYENGTLFNHVKSRSLEIEKMLVQYISPEKISTNIQKERTVIVIEAEGKNQRSEILEAAEIIKASFRDVFIFIEESNTDRKDNTSSFSVAVTGPDHEQLEKLVNSISIKINSAASRIVSPDTVSVIYHFKKQLPGIKTVIDSSRTDSAGIMPADIYRNIFFTLTKPVISKWIFNNEEIDIKTGSGTDTFSDIEKYIKLPVIAGNQVLNLSDFASIEFEKRYGSIYHTGRERGLVFSVSVPGGKSDAVFNMVKSIIEDIDFPPGYKAEPGRKYLENIRLLKEIQHGLIISLLIIFLILVFYFENFNISLKILLLLLVSLSFPVIFLRLYSRAFTVISGAGLILSGGISVNSMIIVFDSLNDKSQKYQKTIYFDDAVNAVNSRLEALFVSSLTTILGLLPFAAAGFAGRSIFAPLAITMASGAAGSLLTVVFLMPLLFRDNVKSGLENKL